MASGAARTGAMPMESAAKAARMVWNCMFASEKSVELV